MGLSSGEHCAVGQYARTRGNEWPGLEHSLIWFKQAKKRRRWSKGGAAERPGRGQKSVTDGQRTHEFWDQRRGAGKRDGRAQACISVEGAQDGNYSGQDCERPYAKAAR